MTTHIATEDELHKLKREYSELLNRVRMYQLTAHLLGERHDTHLRLYDRLEKRVQDLETPPRQALPQEPIREEIVRLYLEVVEELAGRGASPTQVRSILAADGCETPECSHRGETFTVGFPIRDRVLAARRDFGLEEMERAREAVTSPAVFSVLHAAATASLPRSTDDDDDDAP